MHVKSAEIGSQCCLGCLSQPTLTYSGKEKTYPRRVHSELSSAKIMQFLVFSNNFATTNLKHLKFGITHFFYVPWMIFVFSRPARPYQGQVSDLLAFVQIFFGNSQRSILKVQEFVKKSLLKKCSKAASL